MGSSIVVVSSVGWQGVGSVRDILEGDRAGWPDTTLIAWPEQPAGWQAGKWWRETGGEIARVGSIGELLAACRTADLAVFLVRHLDPDAVEALDIRTELCLPTLMCVQGAYPMPKGERITYRPQEQRRAEVQEIKTQIRKGLRAA